MTSARLPFIALLENFHQKLDVANGKPQCFDFRKLRVWGDVWDMIPKLSKCCVHCKSAFSFFTICGAARKLRAACVGSWRTRLITRLALWLLFFQGLLHFTMKMIALLVRNGSAINRYFARTLKPLPQWTNSYGFRSCETQPNCVSN